MSSILARLRNGDSSQGIRQSTALTTVYLLEMNRKFESFMRDKVEELEGRVAAQIGLGGPFDQPFKLFESQQKRVGGQAQFGHRQCPFRKRQCSSGGPETGNRSANMVLR